MLSAADCSASSRAWVAASVWKRLEGVEAGAGLDVLEHDQRVAGPDPGAVPDQNLADDPALEMLHDPPAAVGADHAGRDRGAGERRTGRPPADAAEEQDDHQNAGPDRPP
jgi:hypothetical protein